MGPFRMPPWGDLLGFEINVEDEYSYGEEGVEAAD